LEEQLKNGEFHAGRGAEKLTDKDNEIRVINNLKKIMNR
jgi:hypothetical protein